MNVVILILVLFTADGHVQATAATFSSVRQCNKTGEALAHTAISGPKVKRALWRCETAAEGADAPPNALPPCNENDCRKG